jgi:beta-galactosidase
MLHVFPHWTWTPGDTIDVWAYTNGDEVELFLNGRSLGTRRETGDTLHVWWRVPYAPGVLRAVARRAGRVTATREVRTAGAPLRVALAPDRSRLRADGEDLSFVTVTVLDRAGVPVPTAEHWVRFRVVGGGARLDGVDNGDQFSHASLKADSVKLFNGKALVIVRSGERTGTATLSAAAQGLAPASVPIAQVRP